eukprot:6194627-Pleurochrysis_carterae.AAC.5
MALSRSLWCSAARAAGGVHPFETNPPCAHTTCVVTCATKDEVYAAPLASTRSFACLRTRVSKSPLVRYHPLLGWTPRCNKI